MFSMLFNPKPARLYIKLMLLILLLTGSRVETDLQKSTIIKIIPTVSASRNKLRIHVVIYFFFLFLQTFTQTITISFAMLQTRSLNANYFESNKLDLRNKTSKNCSFKFQKSAMLFCLKEKLTVAVTADKYFCTLS